MLVPLGFSNISTCSVFCFFSIQMLVKRLYWHLISLIIFPPLSIIDFRWFVSQLTITKEKYSMQITSLLKPFETFMYFSIFFINVEAISVTASILLYTYVVEIIIFVVADFFWKYMIQKTE